MIISLEEAKKVHPEVTQTDLDGIETMIRALTHNNFQKFNIRVRRGIRFEGNTISTTDSLFGFKEGNTIQVSSSIYYDGLYVIKSIENQKITIEGDTDFPAHASSTAFVTLIDYPADILLGVIKLLKYDAKMAKKIGIKSETISRWRVDYYDLNSTDSSEGYPIALMKFVNKYKKLRW